MARFLLPAMLVAAIVLGAVVGHADVIVTTDIAFNAVGRNPYSNQPAWEFGDTVTLFDDSFRANIPPFNANPTQIAVEALADALGVPLPDLIQARVGASVAAHANVSFGYYVTAGRLDIAYPAGTSLQLQTAAEGDFVITNNAYTIGANFLPGAERTVPFNLAGIAGAGYLNDPLQGVSFNSYTTPRFATTSPWASAWLDASADVHGSVFTSVSALGGLIKARKDFRVDGHVGGRLVEIDPTGLFVAGEEVFGYDITQPIGPIPIAGNAAQLEITIPQLGLASNAPAPGSSIVTANATKEVLSVQGNMEKLIPLVGPILQNSLGPFEYDLLQLKGGPVVSLTQQMTFTPTPRVKLQFSEPVLVRDTSGVFHQTFEHEFDLNQQGQPAEPIEWLPMFSNQDEISITPVYILDNAFRNRTGLQFDIEVDVEALSLETPFPAPLDRIPHLVDETITIPIAEFELFTTPDFRISIPNVTARPITIGKRNVPLASGAIGDLTLFSSTSGGVDVNGNDVVDLVFVRDFVGGETRQYQVTVVGDSTFIAAPGSTSEDLFGSDIFMAFADVVLTDPVTLDQVNVGKNFCTGGCDWSSQLPSASPFYSEQPDPSLPGFDPIYVSQLPNVLETDIDPVSHPELGVNNAYHHNSVTNTEYGTEWDDLRIGPTTEVLVRSGEFEPGTARQFAFLSGAELSENGAASFTAFGAFGVPVDVADYVEGLYAVSGEETEAYVRSGDATAAGDGFIFPVTLQSGVSVNDIGQAVFVANVTDLDGIDRPKKLFRTDSGGPTPVAQVGESVPDGAATYADFYAQQINDQGSVAFLASLSDLTEPSNDQALYLSVGTTITEIIRRGDTLSGFAGKVLYFNAFQLNESGEFAYSLSTDQDEQAVFLKSGNSVIPVVRTGGAAPGDGVFQYHYGGFMLNSSGQVSFKAEVASDDNSSVGWTGIFRADGDQIAEIARTGQSAPAEDGTLYNLLFGEVLNDSGQVAFRATVATTLGPSYDAIFLANGGDLREIVRTNQATPDGDGVFSYDDTEPFSTAYALNNHGHLAFRSVVAGAADGSNVGIFLFDGLNLVTVVRKGQDLAGSTVTELAFDSAIYDGNYGDGLNDNMQVAYHARLADGRTVIARFEPHLYWKNSAGGDWGTTANWSLGVAPHDPYDVFVIAEHAVTVAGPYTDQTIKSLTLGGDDSADATLNLATGTTLVATNGTAIRANGILEGYGNLSGSVRSSGTIRVGDSGIAPAMTRTITGDLVLDAGSRLELDLQGVLQFDRLAMAGTAFLEGELAVGMGDFSPTLGSVFQILSAAGGVSGQFDMTVSELPELMAGLGWLIDYDADRVELRVVVETAGDFSSNGVVGPEDFVVWKANYGSTDNLSADANRDGVVDAADYTIWRDLYGQSLGLASAKSGTSTVPEPSAILLMAVAAAIGSREAQRPARLLRRPNRALRSYTE